MATHPNMATITASIERSLQNCSLNHHHQGEGGGGGGSSNEIMSINESSAPPSFVPGRSSTSDSTDHHNHLLSDNTLELNSDIRLPYYWEQCLDLKTGEIYYINWRTGMKSHEDPRANQEMKMKGGNLLLCSGGGEEEEEEEDDEEEEDSSYESQGSSTEESSTSTATAIYNGNHHHHRRRQSHIENKTQLLPQVVVVGGCKRCFMYFMVPRHVGDCPKCFGQLLHFDPSQNAST